MEASERVMTEDGDAEGEHVNRLKGLLNDLVRKERRSYERCQGTGYRLADRGLVDGRSDQWRQ